MTKTTSPLTLAGVDVGGTFTDLVLFRPEEGTLVVSKVPSTPADQSQGVLAGLQSVLPDLAGLDRLFHGTTVSTNAVLQHNGASVAMVTGEGFRDILEIGRTRRMLPSLYDTNFVRAPPLVPRPLRFEVAERLAARGRVLVPLDEKALLRVARKIRKAGVEAVAVCFLHAYHDDQHEQRAMDLLREELPAIWVTTSAEVVPEFREYERFSTTVLNAYLLPVMDRYMATLGKTLAEKGYGGPIFTMSSSGGTMDLEAARKLPVRTILSGPVGGVAGALWITQAIGLDNVITCDMGGTSTDVCLIENGSPAKVTETAFIGYPIKGLQIDINTVGAGGGSVAYVEGGSILNVGPRSAGAYPGPACYGRGGEEPTVTDANMVLGRTGRRRLGGSIKLDAGLARKAVQTLARRLGIKSMTEMAEGIIALTVAQIANAIREVSIERGLDPGDFTLVAFGGAGPMHAAQVADELGIREVLIPLHPGNLSALGLLASDQRYERVQTCLAPLSGMDLQAFQALLDSHRKTGKKEMHERGFDGKDVRIVFALDMRYARQGFELTVELPDREVDEETLRQAFLKAYARHYGHADPDGQIEMVNLRTTLVGMLPKPRLARRTAGNGTPDDALTANRKMVVNGSATTAPIYEREHLPVGKTFSGPAIVQEDGATTVVLPGWQANLDEFGSLRLRAG